MTGDVNFITKYYPFFDDLLMLRRSTASTLPVSAGGIGISIKFIIPTHEVKTVKLFYNKKAAETQWVHRFHAKCVCSVKTVWKLVKYINRSQGVYKWYEKFPRTKFFNDRSPKTTWSFEKFDYKKDIYLFNVRVFSRHFTIANAFLFLNRFDRSLNKIGQNNLVENVNRLLHFLY